MSVLKENAKKAAMSAIKLELTDTMLNLVYDMCDLYLSKPQKLEVPADINELIEKVKKHAVDLPQILNKDLNERDSYVKELGEIKKEYLKLCMPIFLYMRELDRIGGYAAWQYECLAAEEMPAENYHEIMHSIIHYTEDYTEKYREDPMAVSAILAKVPLRMTRERYYDIVRDALKVMLEDADEGDAKTAVNICKISYYPKGMEEYGTLLPEVKEFVDNAGGERIDKMTQEELEDYLGGVDSQIEAVTELKDYINIAYNDINLLTSLAAFCIDEEYVTDGDMVLNDILYTCCNMIDDGDYELYAETLQEKTGDRIESGFEDLKSCRKQIRDYTEKLADIEDEELDSILGTYAHINMLYSLELEDEIAVADSGDGEPIDEAAKAAYIDEVIDFMQSLPDDIAPSKNKYMRRKMFGILPVKMTDDELTEYMHYAFEPLEGKGTGMAALTELYYMLADADIIEDIPDDEDEHDHAHHHHGHGHDHSHLHVIDGCGCGHDHHDHKH